MPPTLSAPKDRPLPRLPASAVLLRGAGPLPRNGVCTLGTLKRKIKTIGPLYGPLVWNPYMPALYHVPNKRRYFYTRSNQEEESKGPNYGPSMKGASGRSLQYQDRQLGTKGLDRPLLGS